MDEKKLLKDLRRLVREEDAADNQRFDDRWRRLADGTISPEEDAELRALAEESEEARLDYEAFRPLDPQIQERLKGQWQAQSAAKAPAAPEEPAAPPSRSQVMPHPAAWHRQRGWLAAAAVFVAALGGALLLNRSQKPPLPAYTHELQGALQATRSADPEAESEVPIFVMGSRLRLVLRPPEAVKETLDRRFVVESADGNRFEWEPGVFTAAGGVVQVDGTVGQELAVEPGDWTLLVYYGRPGEVPDFEALDGHEVPTDRLSLLRIPFRVVPDSSGAELEAPDRSSLEVEYAGCYAVTGSTTCVPRSELRVWVRGPPAAEIDLRIDGRIADTSAVWVDGGQRHTIEVPEGAARLELCATVESRPCWSLNLGPVDQPDWYIDAKTLNWEARQSREHRGGGGEAKIEQARQTLEEHLTDAVGGERGLALSLLARLADTRTDVEVGYLEEAVELHRLSGQLLEQARDTAALVNSDYLKHDLDTAARRLEALVLPEKAPAEAKFQRLYNRGILMNKRGRYRQALDLLHRASDLARRFELGQRLAAEQMLASTLRRVGRFAEALANYRSLIGSLASISDSCQRAVLLNNYASNLILSPDTDGDDPLPWLQQGLEIARRDGCAGGRLELDLLLNQGLAQEENGETWEALKTLLAVDALGLANTLQRLWHQDIEGQIAITDKRALDALERYRAMEELARQAAAPAGEWRSKIGQARAHVMLGQLRPALAALTAAEVLLDAGHFEVPIDQGREAFVAQREEGARLHLDVLLRMGRLDEAFQAARRSRARVLSGLLRGSRLADLTPDEQVRWDADIAEYQRLRAKIVERAEEAEMLPEERRREARGQIDDLWHQARAALDRALHRLSSSSRASELPPLGKNEVMLLYHPLPTGWVGFAATRSSVETAEVELPWDLTDLAKVSKELLRPFQEQLRKAAKARILPYGPLHQIDFHALPFDGDILLRGLPVVYGLDIEVDVRTGARAATTTRRALVVPPDPFSGLPMAQHEAEDVAESLASRSKPWDVELPDGAQATAANIRQLLGDGFDLLHYSGHGQFQGTFGWQSALHLAGGTRLTVSDILALENVPTHIVLSSCESGQQTRQAPVASLGLAQAFLVAGARSVVAATQQVDDQATADFFVDFHKDWDGETELAEQLQQTQLQWWDKGSQGWASFRAFEP